MSLFQDASLYESLGSINLSKRDSGIYEPYPRQQSRVSNENVYASNNLQKRGISNGDNQTSGLQASSSLPNKTYGVQTGSWDYETKGNWKEMDKRGVCITYGDIGQGVTDQMTECSGGNRYADDITGRNYVAGERANVESRRVDNWIVDTDLRDKKQTEVVPANKENSQSPVGDIYETEMVEEHKLETRVDVHEPWET